MTHPDGDTLLKFELQMLEEQEHEAVQRHLLTCNSCRELHQKVLGDVTRLRNFTMDVTVPAPPPLIRHPLSKVEVWRWAAVLAAGFLLGYITANLSESVRPIPVQQHMMPTSEKKDSVGFVSCPAVDAKAAFRDM